MNGPLYGGHFIFAFPKVFEPVQPSGLLVRAEALVERRRVDRQTGKAGLDAHSAPRRGDERSEESTETILPGPLSAIHGVRGNCAP